jgi:hypothetical protein
VYENAAYRIYSLGGGAPKTDDTVGGGKLFKVGIANYTARYSDILASS